LFHQALNFSHNGKDDVMATTETFVPGRLYEMPLADLQPDPNQPRKYLDPVALDELTESVKQQSVVAPILFRVENGIAYVIAGERRSPSRGRRRRPGTS